MTNEIFVPFLLGHQLTNRGHRQRNGPSPNEKKLRMFNPKFINCVSTLAQIQTQVDFMGTSSMSAP